LTLETDDANVSDMNGIEKAVKTELMKVDKIYPYGGDSGLEVMRTEDGSEYPLPTEHSIKVGMVVEIIPQTTYHESGGSITRYNIKPVENKIKPHI